MALSTLVWKLASPYDAYVSHVAELNNAIDRIRHLSGLALGYEAGLQSSVRIVLGGADTAMRAERFRSQLGENAANLTDEEFEAFLSMLGGGATADVDHDRDRAASRLGHATRGLEEYFAVAGHELGLLEQRGYSPNRPDVARQLRENRLPAMDVSEYRHLLRELAASVGRQAE